MSEKKKKNLIIAGLTTAGLLAVGGGSYRHYTSHRF